MRRANLWTLLAAALVTAEVATGQVIITFPFARDAHEHTVYCRSDARHVERVL